MSHAHVKPFALARPLRLGVVTALVALAISVPAGLAQTPVADATESHPAHIHSGTCAELGDVVAPLENVEPPAGEATGPESAHAVDISRTFVDLPLEDIIAGGHAVNVHLSDDEIGTYIACGDIGGVLTEEGERTHLIIGLGELNDSGHTGIAWLGSTEDGQTEVVISLIEPDELD
jgi:hypothetical protein